MRTQEATASTNPADGVPSTDDAQVEEITALSSQVSSAFGELSRVQAELAARMERFSEREARLEEQRAELQNDRDEHEARVSRAERIACQAEAREAAVAGREESVGRREDAAGAFRDLLVRMTDALDDPTPTKLSEAFEAATTSLRDSHAALTAKANVVASEDVDAANGTEAEPSGDEPIAAGPVEDADSNADVDLGDLSEEELRKLRMLQKLCTASTAEIAEQIRGEREDAGQKKRGWFS
ncbi:MAG: hypothetical protein V3R77_04760 [Candidatus Binatia bacterium]